MLYSGGGVFGPLPAMQRGVIEAMQQLQRGGVKRGALSRRQARQRPSEKNG